MSWKTMVLASVQEAAYPGNKSVRFYTGTNKFWKGEAALVGCQ